jgi:hypothetical protein
VRRDALAGRGELTVYRGSQALSCVTEIGNLRGSAHPDGSRIRRAESAI